MNRWLWRSIQDLVGAGRMNEMDGRWIEETGRPMQTREGYWLLAVNASARRSFSAFIRACAGGSWPASIGSTTTVLYITPSYLCTTLRMAKASDKPYLPLAVYAHRCRTIVPPRSTATFGRLDIFDPSSFLSTSSEAARCRRRRRTSEHPVTNSASSPWKGTLPL